MLNRTLRKLSLVALSFLPSTMVQAQSEQEQPPSLQSGSMTYLVCYYRNKVTGESSWAWGKDSQNQFIKINGEWTDLSLKALLKINGYAKDFEQNYISSCQNTNSDVQKEYVEYGVANNILSYKHQIWFEQIPANDFHFPFSRLVVFGDSLSDNGNLYNYSHRTFGAGSYYMGRFSNGPVWSEYLSKQFNLELYDWAVAGVTTDVPIPIPYTMNNQVDHYTSAMTHVANPAYAQTLYAILIGANNYIFNMDPDPKRIVNSISDSLEKLIAGGARYFLVPNLPDISVTPFLLSQGKVAQQAMHNKITVHNQLLAEATKQIKEKYSFIHILTPDVNGFLNDVVTNPAGYHVSNVNNVCDAGLPMGNYNSSSFCDDPKTYLFWDAVHPTTKIHCEMAQNIMDQLSESYQVTRFYKDYNQCDLSYVNKI